MSDMLKVIEPKSDQINAEDLIAGERIITITGVRINAGTEQPVSMTFAGSDKVFRPCKTVSRIIVKGWGADSSQYVGRSLQLFCDPDVTWAGMKVGGIRVRAMSHIDEPLRLALAESKKARRVTVVQPLAIPASGAETKTRQTPDQWAAMHIAALKAASSVDDLAALRAKGAKALLKLQAARPDLYAMVIAADPASAPQKDDDDPFGLPAVTDQPDDGAAGDDVTPYTATDEETHPAVAAAQAIIDELMERNSRIAVDGVLTKHKADLTAMPEEYRSRVYAEAEAFKAGLEG